MAAAPSNADFQQVRSENARQAIPDVAMRVVLIGGFLKVALFASFAAAKIPSAIGGNASQAPKLRREDWSFPNQDSVLFGGTILKKPMQFYEYEVVPLFH